MVRALFAIVVAGACGADPEVASDASTSDAARDASTVIPWESVETISDDGQIIVERVAYRSEGLLVYARVCRPVAIEPLAAIVYNHGGYVGLDVDPEVARCQETARLGYVWLGSSYRGEDGSEGRIEICLGEVTDVLELIRVARTQPYVDPTRILMWGASHGGCITTRAVQRGAPVVAAMDVFGPSDWTKLYRYWRDQVTANAPNASVLRQLMTTMETATGGTPEEQPAEYAARSPLAVAGEGPAGVPLLVAHGTADDIVPPEQSCELGLAWQLESYHVDGTGTEVTTPPAGCAQPITWRADPRPTSWPGARYLVVYDGLGHETASTPAQRMLIDLATFAMAKL